MLISDDKDIEEQRKRSAERGGNGILQGPVEDGPAKGRWVGPGSPEWAARHLNQTNAVDALRVTTNVDVSAVQPDQNRTVFVTGNVSQALRHFAEQARLTVIEREILLRAAGILETVRS